MKRLLVLFMALCMLFAFTACAQFEAVKDLEQKQNELKETIDDVTNGDVDADELVEDLDEFTDAASDAGMTTDISIQDYVDELVKNEEWQSQVETFESQGLSAKIEARGNSLAYIYQYTVDIPDTTVVKTSLDATQDSLKSLADSLRTVLSSLDSVIFEYLDINGNIIATYEF